MKIHGKSGFQSFLDCELTSFETRTAKAKHSSHIWHCGQVESSESTRNEYKIQDSTFKWIYY